MKDSGIGSLGSDDWRKVRFGDVVKNVKVTENRETTDIDRYVAGEHMQTEDVHIREWGEMNGDYLGPAFHRRFEPGQILYGSRRTYLKKVAVAPFTGICANTTFVLEPHGDGLSPRLLPFLMLSDAFTEHSIRESKGSVNPYINWKDIAKFEFCLPPRAQQEEIATVLWAADAVVEEWLKATKSLTQFIDVATSQFFGRQWETVKLEQVLNDLQYGSSKRTRPQSESTVPMLRIPNVVGGSLNLDDLAFVDLPVSEREKYSLQPTDVLIVRTNGNPDYVGRTTLAEGAPTNCVYASYLIRLRCDGKRLLPAYLHTALSSLRLRRTLRHEIRSSAGNYNLNTKGIKRQKLPLPPMPEQCAFVDEITQYRRCLTELSNHIEVAKRLKLNLVNSLLIPDV